MAKLEISRTDDFMRQLEQLGARGEEIGKKMVDSALPILEKQVKDNYKKIPLSDRSLGDVEKSITIKKASVKRTRKGMESIKGYVTFKGEQRVYKSSKNKIKPRQEAVRNGEIAAYIEYGTQGKPARPFLRIAVEQTKTECMKKMGETFDEEVNRLFHYQRRRRT